MAGWRLTKSDGSDPRDGLSLAEVRNLIEKGRYGGQDLVASPTQQNMLRIESVAVLRKHLRSPIATEPDLCSADMVATSDHPPLGLPRSAGPPESPRAQTVREDSKRLPTHGPAILGGSGGPVVRRGLGEPAEDAEDAEIEISSMIDVVFQLLIFFMVCSLLQQTHGVDVPATETGIGVEPGACVFVSIRPADGNEPGAKPVLFVGDDEQPISTVDETAQKAADQIESSNKQRIIIKADSSVHFGVVRDLMQAIRERTDVAIATGVKEKN